MCLMSAVWQQMPMAWAPSWNSVSAAMLYRLPSQSPARRCIRTPCAADDARVLFEEGEARNRLSAALDFVAEFLAFAKQEGKAVIFRPFHEDNGYWFWWGTGTSAEDYRKLWILVHESFDAKGLDNLLYAYSPNGAVLRKRNMVCGIRVMPAWILSGAITMMMCFR